MTHRILPAALVFTTTMILTLPVGAQQKNVAPALRSAQTLRVTNHSRSANTKKPINQTQVFALLVGQVPIHPVVGLVQERGIDFQSTDEYLEEVVLAGGQDELVTALKSAKVTKPKGVDPTIEARETDVRQHVARSAELLMTNRYVEAEAEDRAALSLDPQNSDAHADLGLVLGTRGDTDGAVAEEREALRLDPNSLTAHANLAMALAFKGDWDAATSEFRAALSLIPQNDVVHVCLGMALGKRGNMDGAVAEYGEALRLNPNNDDAHAFLGAALGGRGDWDGAIKEYNEAIRLSPEVATVHYGLGGAIEAKGGDLKEALSEYRLAYYLDSRNPTFRQAFERLTKEVSR